MIVSNPSRRSQTPERTPGLRAKAAVNNSLLATLDERRSLRNLGLADATLRRSQVLQNSVGRVTQVYFPTTAVLSLTSALEPGRATEIASIGREGVSGLIDAWFDGAAPARLSVQIPGHAYAMRQDVFRALASEHSGFRTHLKSFERHFMTQIIQSASCYRYHSARQQCARWLLVNCARTGCLSLPMTHDLLADLLGVFRPTVTVALRELQTMGLLQLQRGLVTVLDEAGLAAEACSCYGSFREYFQSPAHGLLTGATSASSYS